MVRAFQTILLTCVAMALGCNGADDVGLLRDFDAAVVIAQHPNVIRSVATQGHRHTGQ